MQATETSSREGRISPRIGGTAQARATVRSASPIPRAQEVRRLFPQRRASRLRSRETW